MDNENEIKDDKRITIEELNEMNKAIRGESKGSNEPSTISEPLVIPVTTDKIEQTEEEE